MTADPRERATRLLSHYLRAAWKAAGLAWEPDHDTEVACIVEALVEVVNDAVREYTESAPHIYADGSTS
jgi:hypothetical protein